MTVADIIIIITIATLLIAIIAFNIVRRKKGKSPCSHCPSRKNCLSHKCETTLQKSGHTLKKSLENQDISTLDGALDIKNSDVDDNANGKDKASVLNLEECSYSENSNEILPFDKDTLQNNSWDNQQNKSLKNSACDGNCSNCKRCKAKLHSHNNKQ